MVVDKRRKKRKRSNGSANAPYSFFQLSLCRLQARQPFDKLTTDLLVKTDGSGSDDWITVGHEAVQSCYIRRM